MKKMLALIVSLCLLLSAVPALAEVNLAGTYVLDASPLGMPMKMYLIIDEANHFQWTNKLEGGVDKGNGEIGSKDGTYVMKYSDSTNENLKMATFTVEKGALVFSTRVPYGAAGISPNTEENLFPTAKKLVAEEALGLYVGSHQVEAMGSVITYEYELELMVGAEYILTSKYAVMGMNQEYVQQGVFELADGEIILNADALPEQKGTWQDGVINVNAYVSAQSKAGANITLKKATTAEAAGVYTGVKDMSAMGFYANATLKLDAVGGYTYESVIDGEAYTEKGTFTHEGTKVVLQSDAEGAAAVEGTLEAKVLNIKMKISPAVPMSTLIPFYHENIQGTFTCEGEDELGIPHYSTLVLNPDGTYSLNVDDMYFEDGTFKAAVSPLGVALTLVSPDGLESTGMVSDTINITHNIDYSYNTLGFTYAK